MPDPNPIPPNDLNRPAPPGAPPSGGPGPTGPRLHIPPPSGPGPEGPRHRFPPWSGRRPGWWPEGEPWPPQGEAGWQIRRQYRGRFMQRAFFGLLFIIILTIGGCTLSFWLAASAFDWQFGPPGPVGPHPFPRLIFLPLGVLVLIISGVFLAVRGLRRVTAPVDDYMEAVARVADGDFAARVPERGPRENRRLARAFNTMTERLEANDAHRRSLLADVTHELRTPLTVIQGNLEGLLDGVYPADATHLTPILDETRVLARLIDDLRTLAQAESGTLALHREPTDLGVLGGEAVAAFRAQAATQGVTLTLNMADDLPLANVDPLRLREVLTNLIANALRYTPAGGRVTLSGRLEAGPPEPTIVLEVADTGAGIAPDRLPHIFDRFYKSADSPGTGLGLAIAKNLVAAHDGELTATSALGAGTTMLIHLPAE